MTTDPRFVRVQRNVERDLRRRYRRQLAKLTDEQRREYLASESRRYALAFMAVAHPETA